MAIPHDAVVDSMSDAVMVLDNQGAVLDLNPAARRLLGVAGLEVIGQSALDVLPVLRDLDLSDVVHGGQTEIAWEEGETHRYFDLRVLPFYRQEQLAGRLVMLRDVTARKLAEEALQLRNAELQARNEELDAFAHTVAHDLKNPLGVVMGFADLFLQDFDTLESAELRDGLQHIHRSAQKMNSIIEELLLLAGVRKMDVQVTQLDTASLVAGALDRLAFLIQERGAEIVAPEQWPAALGYGPWVEEVWANYISNAVKYGGASGTPRVELGATAQPDGTVRFWVKDNGPGLSAAEQARLFTPFTRLDQVRAKGHGLGLSIVQRIIQKLGGEVGVESAPGEGSTFYFALRGMAQP